MKRWVQKGFKVPKYAGDTSRCERCWRGLREAKGQPDTDKTLSGTALPSLHSSNALAIAAEVT
jgi:hypothetical protein